VKLEFRLLGDIAVLADGQPLDLGGTRQRSVLALLLLNRNRPLATELLADRLWPDEQPLTAVKTIQVYVSRLRHVLGPAADRLTSSPTGYRLAVADEELDAARFERGLRQAREALGAGSAETARRTLEEAIRLWSGPSMGDLATEPFARREADRLEELRLQAHEELFELRIAAGMARETIGELRRLTGEQPGRERLWRLLMVALWADGRQAEALEAYHDARRYLAEELGLDPGPDLQELEHAILTQEAPRPGQDGLATAVSATSASAVTAEAGPVARRRRVVTVLRAEVVSASAGDLDPEVLEARGRRALEVVRRAVERHGGTIDGADPNGITAVFGLTVAREDDALRAVRAAVELTDDAGSVASADASTFGVGVVTGEVLSGPGTSQGSTLAGSLLKAGALLATRAGPREVLLAPETAGLVRGATTTEPASLESDTHATGSPAVRLLGLTDGEAIVRRTTTPFVGRAAELDTLLAAFDRVVAEGAPGLATVIGAPGVGKSRLVAESFARIAKRAAVLRSRCLPYGEGITYWPVRELILTASGDGSDEPAHASLGTVDGVIARLDGAEQVRNGLASIMGPVDEPVPAEDIRWAVRRFFEALATERPLVLLVDDLQWAEPVLVELLEHVLDLGRGPILLVAIARPELEETRQEWLTRPNLSLMRLEALNEADAATLLDHLAPELPAGPLRSRILATAEGNPLFVEQFVAYVSDEAGAAGRGPNDRTAADLPIPPTIGALLAARLDRLPEGERRLLERAAVIGRTFWSGALKELLADPERAELSGRLARLARRGLIRPDRTDFPDEEAYRFRHLLIRDAAYASLPKRERADLHERFAGWLEGRSGSNPGAVDLIVAYHLEQAYRYHLELGAGREVVRQLADRALAFIAPAGLAAGERGDPHAAISLLSRAIALDPPAHERIALLIELREALLWNREREASDAIDAEAGELLAEYPDEGLEHRRRLAEAEFAGVAMTDGQAAYEYYKRVGDDMGMVRALEVLANMHRNELRYTASLELFDEATAIALRIGRRDRAARLSGLAGIGFGDSPLPVPEALARLRRYLELAEGSALARALILLALGEHEARSGIVDRWRRHFDAAKAIADEHGLQDPFGLFAYPMYLSFVELDIGEPARVMGMLQELCSTLERLGLHLGGLASAAPLTAQVLLAVGRLDEVERYAYWGRDIADADDLDAQVRWRRAISGLRSRQGRDDEAIALARQAVALSIGTEAVGLLRQSHMSLAEALRAAGDEPAARDAAREAHRLAATKQDQAVLRKIDAFLAAT
jgi:DNA-binding SARP family transcriptional activator